MGSLTLAVQQRIPGNSITRKLRREGKVPGTLYGHGAAPISISVEAKEFAEMIRSGAGHHLMMIVIDGKNTDSVLLRSVQRDPLSGLIVHADFQRVATNESIRASIPLTLTGIAAGVKQSGGVLDVVLHQLEVSGPADQLPEHLDFDMTALEIGAVVHASEITLPSGFALVTTAEAVVLTIDSPRAATETGDGTPETKTESATGTA